MLWKALRRMKRAQHTAHFTGDLGVCKGLGQMWPAWLDPQGSARLPEGYVPKQDA